MRIVSVRNLLVTLAFAACAHSQNPGGGGGGGGQTGGNSAPVPAEVRKTIDAVLGPTASVASEQDGGVTIYEAAVQTKLGIELSASGQLQRAEVALPVAALPTAVTAALASKGTISEAEVVVSPSGVAFEVEIGNQEILIDAAGKILEQHQEAEDEKDDDDD